MAGLGNQMFQYAAGRRLSILHQTALKLDITHYQRYRYRKYGLQHFCIQEAFATPQEIARVRGTPKSGLARITAGLNRKLNPFYRPPIFAELYVRPFDPRIWDTPKDVYLAGYWQSEAYFQDIQDIIRREFVLRNKPDRQNQEMAAKITDTTSVSIHVRRGDYVSDAHINQVHGCCGLDYYGQCVRLIAEYVPNPHFYVFSDDPAWTQENLSMGYPTTLVSHNGTVRGYDDLRLMALCQHNIIANSSFSWWGAWLNANPDKIVLAPQRWFRDPALDASDLIPDGWIKITSE